jgi:hypothetical protein
VKGGLGFDFLTFSSMFSMTQSPASNSFNSSLPWFSVKRNTLSLLSFPVKGSKSFPLAIRFSSTLKRVALKVSLSISKSAFKSK